MGSNSPRPTPLEGVSVDHLRYFITAIESVYITFPECFLRYKVAVGGKIETEFPDSF